MASSTQFSIRGLMALTVAVAVIAASVAPVLRQLEPQHWPRAILYLSLLGSVVGAFAAGSCLRRRRVEKQAGRLLSRTEIGGTPLRWASLVAAVLLVAMAAGMVVLLASIDSIDVDLRAVEVVLRSFVALMSLSAASSAAGLFFYWWWGTGPLATEAFENGLVLHGLAFVPWSKVVSYERATLFIVNALTRRGTRRIRIRVAVEDRAEWERILSEKGVPPVKSLVESDSVSSVERTK